MAEWAAALNFLLMALEFFYAPLNLGRGLLPHCLARLFSPRPFFVFPLQDDYVRPNVFSYGNALRARTSDVAPLASFKA